MKALALTALLSLFSVNAWATDVVFASCYSPNSQLLMGFDADLKMFTYTYSQGSSVVIGFQSQPSTGWAANYSSINVTGLGGDVVDLRAHIVNGDPETPLIETDVEIQVQRSPTGGYFLTSVALYHLDQAVNLNEFVGQTCYVQ